VSTFHYQPPFPLGPDTTTPYRLLTRDLVSVTTFEGQEILKVDPAALTLLANEAVRDISFLLRPGHLKQVAAILDDPESSDNDRMVALTLLRNAEIGARGILPTCQDTGTAIVMGKKGQRVWTGGGDEEALARGVWKTYQEENLRYSQLAPLSLFEETNTRDNLPCQIDLQAVDGESYEFLFITKGGGSANKSLLFQETKSLLNRDRFLAFAEEKMRSLGTSACPPYHLVFVVGGTSAEHTLKVVKLASTRYLDTLPTQGSASGQAFRDVAMEAELLQIARRIGIGAQFGGKHFALDVRVIRLPRHGASCPVGVGVSCSADRQAKAKITRDGVFLEELETRPGQYIPERWKDHRFHGVPVDLDAGMDAIRATLTKYPVTTALELTGTIVVARDIAHAKLRERIEQGLELPEYFKQYPIYYAGPAKKPEGMASGSFGPTTAGRMDPYVDLFQSRGASLVMIAKGNRSQAVTDACRKHGGFYLGSIGGPAAILAQDHIRQVEVLDFPELGMEAVWKIRVEKFPAFILVDDKGNDFFRLVNQCPVHG
jgi:fumarate hydratase class I